MPKLSPECAARRYAQKNVYRKRPEIKARKLVVQNKWRECPQVKAREAQRRANKRQWLRQFKQTLSCGRCPESHPACLYFHHRDPSLKSFTVNVGAVGSYSLERLQEEIDKCDVLCANCHRKLHWEQGRTPKHTAFPEEVRDTQD